MAGSGSEDDSCCALPPEPIAYSVTGVFQPFRQELEIGEDSRSTLLLDGFRQPAASSGRFRPS